MLGKWVDILFAIISWWQAAYREEMLCLQKKQEIAKHKALEDEWIELTRNANSGVQKKALRAENTERPPAKVQNSSKGIQVRLFRFA